MCDRAHGQPGLHAEEGAHAAVAAAELHVDQTRRGGAHRRAAVALEPVADQPELAQAGGTGPAAPRPAPSSALISRQDLVVNEASGAIEVVELGVGEITAEQEVVGAQRLADVGEDGALDGATLGVGHP